MSDAGGSSRGANRAPGSVFGSDASEKSRGAAGNAQQVDYLEHALEVSSRAGVREQAALRSLGGGNLLYDPLGVFLAGDRAVAGSVAGGVTANRDFDGGINAKAAKHRVIDDIILRECLGTNGTDQVVTLCPGFSTRPFRLALPKVTWFEVDSVEVLLFKRLLLRSAGAEAINTQSASQRSPQKGAENKSHNNATHAFAHITKETVRCAKVVGFDVRKELELISNRDDKASAKKPKNNRLQTLLEKNGFDSKKPAVFVVEDLLVDLSRAEIGVLLNSLPATRGSLLVTAHVPKRVVLWAKRVCAAYASGGGGGKKQKNAPASTPNALRLIEKSSRWKSTMSDVHPMGWTKTHANSLQVHAHAYGYLVDPEFCRADEERVVEFRREKRGFLGIPGAPGNVFFPVNVISLLGKVPFVAKVPVLKRLLKSGTSGNNNNYAVTPLGPPATSRAGFFAKTKSFLFGCVGFGGGGACPKRPFMDGHPRDSDAGVVTRRVNSLFGTLIGRIIVIAAAGAVGHVYGNDLVRKTKSGTAAAKRVARETVVVGAALFEAHVAPVLDTKVLPFLDRNVASRMPGSVTFKRKGKGNLRKGIGTVTKASPRGTETKKKR